MDNHRFRTLFGVGEQRHHAAPGVGLARAITPAVAPTAECAQGFVRALGDATLAVVVLPAPGLFRGIVVVALLRRGEHDTVSNTGRAEGTPVSHPGAVRLGAGLAGCRGANTSRGALRHIIAVVKCLAATREGFRALAATSFAIPVRTRLAGFDTADWFHCARRNCTEISVRCVRFF